MKYPGYTRTKKSDNGEESVPGSGPCYNDYMDNKGKPDKNKGLRRWLAHNQTDPTTRYIVTHLPKKDRQSEWWDMMRATTRTTEWLLFIFSLTIERAGLQKK